MVHYDPTLTDDHRGTSMAHHPLKDVEVHSLKRRKWRGEGGEWMKKEEEGEWRREEGASTVSSCLL